MRRILNALLFATLIGTMSCGSIKVPKNVEKAKRAVAQNARQIEAIVEYHGLKSPFTKIDTVVLRIPEKTGRFNVPSRLAADFEYLYADYIFPSIPDTAKAVGIKRKIDEVIRNNSIDYVYLDSLIRIEIRGSVDGVDVKYNILQQEFKKTVETKSYVIDTKVRWHESSYFRIVLLLLFVSLLSVVVYIIIRREGGPLRPPSLFS